MQLLVDRKQFNNTNITFNEGEDNLKNIYGLLVDE